MLDATLFSLSFAELQDVVFHDLTIFHVALVYVLTYVVYKALGRYIYFKPEEHASKINRTFLAISLLIVSLDQFSGFIGYLPFLSEYRWLYAISGLVLLVAPFSILMDKFIWFYDPFGNKTRRNWHYDYLPIPNDYYKTSISKSEKDGNSISSWEEEGVESTRENIHSDALLNLLAVAVFITAGWRWSFESSTNYGYYSFIFFICISLPIIGIFLERSVFSWMEFLERRWFSWKSEKKN